MKRRMTVREGLRLQGLPDEYLEGQPQAFARKLIGNCMSVPVVKAVTKTILDTIDINKFNEQTDLRAAHSPPGITMKKHGNH